MLIIPVVACMTKFAIIFLPIFSNMGQCLYWYYWPEPKLGMHWVTGQHESLLPGSQLHSHRIQPTTLRFCLGRVYCPMSTISAMQDGLIGNLSV